MVFSHEHTQTIWCKLCPPSLAGIRTRVPDHNQNEILTKNENIDAPDRSAMDPGGMVRIKTGFAGPRIVF